MILIFALSFTIYAINAQTNQTDNCTFSNCLKCSANYSSCEQCVDGFIFLREENRCFYMGPCGPGEYKNDTSGKCLNCDGSCKSCWGPGQTNCYTCLEGYYPYLYSYEKKCITCHENHCKDCDTTQECLKCRHGFQLNNETGKCETCQVPNCELCEKNLTYCNQCNNGYKNVDGVCVVKGNCPWGTFPQAPGTCSLCNASCGHCFGPSNKECFTCKEGYYFEGEICLPCASECRTCVYQPDVCTSCFNGYLLRGQDCVTQCDTDEYFDQIENKCKNCHPLCSKCKDSWDNCIACYDETVYKLNTQTHICVPVCAQGQFYNVDSMFDWVYYLWLVAKYHEVDVSKYISKFPGKCDKCNTNCQNCQDYAEYCTDCRSGYYLTEESTCVDMCPQGYFIDRNTATNIHICRKCAYFCLECESEYNCTSCDSRFNLSNGDCFYNSLRTGDCLEDEIQLTQAFCAKNCPVGSKAMEDSCYCLKDCIRCIFDYPKNIGFCAVCRYGNQVTYKGECLNECPKNAFKITMVMNFPKYDINNYPQTFCLDFCPDGYLHFMRPSGEKICVSQCPKGYISLKRSCILPSCPEGTYFDTLKLETLNVTQFNSSDTDYEKILNSLLNAICTTCSSKCSSCTGPNDENCELCSTGYLQIDTTSSNFNLTEMENLTILANTITLEQRIKEIFLKSDLYKNNTSSCQDKCIPGWIAISETVRVCIPCVRNCDICYFEMVRYKELCVFNCPVGSDLNQQTRTCEITQEKLTLIMNIPTVYGSYVSTSKDTPLELYIYNHLNTATEVTVKDIQCVLKYLNGDKNMENGIFVQIRGIKFINYQTKIPSSLLSPNSEAVVGCTLTLADDKVLTNELTIKTAPLPQGIFEVSPIEGYGMETVFTVKLSDWNLKDLALPFTYFLYQKLDDKILGINRFYDEVEIPDSNHSSGNYDDPNVILKTRLNLEKTFLFPIVNQTTNILLILRVYNFLTSVENTYNLTLKVSNKTTIDDLISNFTPSQDYTLDYVSVLVKSFSQMYENQVLNTSFREEEMKKSLNVYYSYKCDPNVDCSNNGECLSDIKNVKIKCSCSKGWFGRSCSWSLKDFSKAQGLLLGSLSTLNKTEINSTNVEEAIRIMESLTAYEDLFNVTNFQSVLNFSETLLFYIQNFDEVIAFTSLLSNIFELMKTQREFLSTDETAQVKLKLQNLLESNLDSVASKLEESSQTELSINFTNIKGKLQSLSFLQTNQLVSDRVLSYPELKVNVTIPKSLGSILNYYADELYTQLIIWPSEVFSKGFEDAESKFFTDALSFDIKKKWNKEVFLPDIQDPISLEFPKIIPVSPQSKNLSLDQIFICKYYDKKLNLWVTNGLNFVGQHNDTLICNTTHLSIFSVLLTTNQSIINQTILPIIDPIDYPTYKEAPKPKLVVCAYYASIYTFAFFVYVLSVCLYSKNIFPEKVSSTKSADNMVKGNISNVVEYAKPPGDEFSPDKNVNNKGLFESEDPGKTNQVYSPPQNAKPLMNNLSPTTDPESKIGATFNTSDISQENSKLCCGKMNKNCLTLIPLVSIILGDHFTNLREKRLLLFLWTISIQTIVFAIIKEGIPFYLPISWVMNYVCAILLAKAMSVSNLGRSNMKSSLLVMCIFTFLAFFGGIYTLSDGREEIFDFLFFQVLIDFVVLDGIVFLLGACFKIRLFNHRGFYFS